MPTWSRPTSSTANAWRAGMSTALAIPSRNASRTIIQTSTIAGDHERGQGEGERPSSPPGPRGGPCVLAGRRRATPANSPRTMTGRNWAVATTPSQNGSPVSCRTSHAWATCCIQVPISEMSWPDEEQPVVPVVEGGRSASEPSRRSRENARARSSGSAGRPAWGRRLVRDGATARRRPRRGARRGARRRVRASSIMVARRAALVSRISIWRSTRASASTRIARRSAGSLRLAEPLAIAFAGGLVLEQLADLGEREPRVVAEAADEQQALEVGLVVEPVIATGARRRLEQADLLVVADRARRQPGLRRHLVDAQQPGRRWGGSPPRCIPQP